MDAAYIATDRAADYVLCMTSHISTAVEAIKSEISRLRSVLAALENGAVASAAPVERAAVAVEAKPAKVGRKKRTRRSSADVKAQAESIVAFVKSKGRAGTTTAEIVKQFGKVLPSIKAFVTSKVGNKLKTSGAGRATIYLVD